MRALLGLASLAAGLLAAGVPVGSVRAGESGCPGASLREAQTALRIAAGFVEDGKPELARLLLRAAGERLASCGSAAAVLACARDLSRARDDVALAYSLHARGQEGRVHDLLMRAAAGLLAHTSALDEEQARALRELHQRITTGFSSPEGAARADLLEWWGELELWCAGAAPSARAQK